MPHKNDNYRNKANKSANGENDNPARVSYISQKTQRLAGALYAVTRVFPSDDPLRATLRRQALSLISCSHALTDGNPSEDSVMELPALLNRLRSQLAVARDGSLISAMNFSVLNDEIKQFIAEINELGVSVGPYLSHDHFTDSQALTSGSIERNISAGSSSYISEGRGGDSPPEKRASSRSDSDQKSQRALSAKDKRRQKILDLFKDQPEITVNDVTDVINGYSTKTIQRDLKALVKSGELEKHGKRRWTSYTRA